VKIKDKPEVRAGHRNLNIYPNLLLFISTGKRNDVVAGFIYLSYTYISNKVYTELIVY